MIGPGENKIDIIDGKKRYTEKQFRSVSHYDNLSRFIPVNDIYASINSLERRLKPMPGHT